MAALTGGPGMSRERSVRAFCIGHQPPCFLPTLDYTLLCPAPLGQPGEVVLADERFGPGVDGGALAEYSQLFGLAELLQAGDVVADRLYLFQYRKFLGLRPGGGPSNAPWLRVLRPDNAALFFPTPEELHTVAQPMLVGGLQGLGVSVAANYAEAHVVDDFATFTACLAADGMPLPEVRRFVSLHGFIPSPALCLVDTPLFLQHMAVLKRVWQLFNAQAAVPRQGYQRRVAGYLLERLHSHLLLQGLHDGSQPHVGTAQRFVVLEPEVPSVGTPARLPANITAAETVS
jgi:hypothetical protein